MAAGAPAGAQAVLLDSAVKPLGLKADEAGLALNYIAELPGGTAAPAGPFAFSGGLRAETPLAPVHLRGRRLASGDIELAWTRRGRIDADSWQAVDIPLDEDVERYRLQILDGATAVRNIEVSAPGHLYTQADEIADFGAPRPSHSIRVRQVGRRVADGIAAEAVISL